MPTQLKFRVYHDGCGQLVAVAFAAGDRDQGPTALSLLFDFLSRDQLRIVFVNGQLEFRAKDGDQLLHSQSDASPEVKGAFVTLREAGDRVEVVGWLGENKAFALVLKESIDTFYSLFRESPFP